ncbi:MAG: allantoinase AllB [Planctomycetota bacterium]
MTGDNHPGQTRALRSRRIVTPTGEVDGWVVLRGERIDAVLPADHRLPHMVDTERVDLGGLALLPGFIDAHVHLNDPRSGEPWEGFDTGTRAAAAGGITTVLDMPLNSLPVTIDGAALQAKRAAAQGRLAVDVGLYGGLVPGNVERIAELLDAGVFGIKAFLCDSGLAEFPAADPDTLVRGAAAMREASPMAPLLAHAERVSPAPAPEAMAERREHGSWAASRPGSFERAAVEELAALSRRTGLRVHVVHVADAGVVEIVRAAKQEGLPMTAETCPHYLVFDPEVDIAEGDTRFKCAPPIRGTADREALWRGLEEGVLDLVASDHSPCPPGMKAMDTGDFFSAWGGIASLQLGPCATWTTASERGASLADLARWWAHGPGAVFEVPAGIAQGLPANLVAFDPDARWAVDGKALEHRHAVTPYEGREMRGRVEHVWLRGARVVEHGAVLPGPKGAVLARSGATEEAAGR